MRLIDADALLEELAGDYNNLEGMPPDLEAAVYAIMDAPTIEPDPARRGLQKLFEAFGYDTEG